MTRRGWIRIAYALTMGLVFAFLQTGYFFQLQLRLTSAYPSFLTITLAWLAGSAAGVWLGARASQAAQGGRPVLAEAAWLAASLIAYYLVLVLLRAAPYRTSMLPLLALLIAVSGVQAGRFFGANSPLFASAGRLFLWENNGFVLGWIAAFAGYVGFGGVFHWAAPALAAIAAAGLRWRS